MLAVLGWDMETPLVGLSIAARAHMTPRNAMGEAHIPRVPCAELRAHTAYTTECSAYLESERLPVINKALQ